MTAGFDRRRDEFPGLAAGAYLLSHSHGPMPRATREALGAYLDRWQAHGPEDAWDAEWWDLIPHVGNRVARILGGAPASVTPLPSATAAFQTALSCLDLEGKKIVTTELDFPSMRYALDALQRGRVAGGARHGREGEARVRRAGIEIEVVPARLDGGLAVAEDDVVAAIDHRTALVALSHVSYRTSARIDPAPIVEAAHGQGARVLLDVYQSAGVCVLDAEGWGVDFMVGGSIKWLCGGPACGYLYVRPDLAPTLSPRLTGWIAHADPLEFAPPPIRLDAGPRRFAQGTPSVPSLYSFLPGLDLILDVGVESIACESRRRTTRMIDAVRERGWTLNTPSDPLGRGGVVMIGLPERRERAIVSALRKRGIFCDSRPAAGVRLSPHFFNTDDEVEQALKALGELLPG